MAVTFRDKDGTTRLAGDLLIGGTTGDVATVQADGTIAPAPGGGSPPTTHEAFEGNDVTIGDQSVDRLTWDDSDGPDTLLDRSNTAFPTVITAGVYAFTVCAVQAAAPTPGGRFDVLLELDRDNADQSVSTSSGPELATGVPSATVSLTYYVPAGAVIAVSVTNLDGGGSRNFALQAAYVQRIA